MAKPEWGTKRTCPNCGTRFYDLGKEDPITCIECGNTWTPEPVLKSKQPIPIDDPTVKKDAEPDSDLSGDDDDDDLKDIENIDDGEDSPDNDVDLGGDDDLGVAKGKGDDEGDDDS
ncbi:MAG: FYDLN acid domain-containing protein [Pseudomonadota bacterium]